MKDLSKIDFSKGKRGPIVPLEPGKERITIRLDRDIVEHFREIVEKAGGGNYQNPNQRCLTSLRGRPATRETSAPDRA